MDLLLKSNDPTPEGGELNTDITLRPDKVDFGDDAFPKKLDLDTHTHTYIKRVR